MIKIVRNADGGHDISGGELPLPVTARKKPVIIEARLMTERFAVKTLEGTMHGNPGDWLITGVQGEMYPCAPDIFDATYELLDKDVPAALQFAGVA